jgi:hypothetical protein
LKVTEEGFEWRGGSLLTPSQRIVGNLVLPWSWIEHINIGDIAGKISFLGGSVTIDLTNSRGSLTGEFIGSSKSVIVALKQTPLGHRE